MCTCSSCEATDAFAKRSFAEWPTGNPAGAKAKTDYAQHRAFCLKWGPGRVPEIPSSIYERDPFPCKGTPFVAPKAMIPGQAHTGERYSTEQMTVSEYVAAFNKLNRLRA